jgi:hypothetical protein
LELVNRDIEGDVRDALVKNSSPTATIIHNFSIITTLIAEILQDDARTQSCKMMTMKKKKQTDITTLITEILQNDARTQSCKMMTMKKKK